MSLIFLGNIWIGMLRPSHQKKAFEAKRVFAGRQEAQEVFASEIRVTDFKDRYRVLMWYGVGGEGKSSLLRTFVRLAGEFNAGQKAQKKHLRVALAKIDFDDDRLKRIDAALYSIRLQLAQQSGFSFNTFDAAFLSYYKKTRPGMNVQGEFPELFNGEKEAVGDLLNLFDSNVTLLSELAAFALPGAGVLYKWGARLTGKLKAWWDTRGNEVLKNIELLSPEELLARLPTFLGIDLCDGIAENAEIRPVILLDTYEALWRERGRKDALADRRADAWVRTLAQDAPGVLFVVAGRDRLRWNEIDPAWNSVIEARRLGGLSTSEAQQFLISVPIPERDIREKIVENSRGLPFYLDLQVSQYEAIRARGETPASEQFGVTPGDILPRFLEHLGDVDEALLRLASYTDLVSEPVMNSLAEAFPARAPNFSFSRMIERSVFEPISEETYAIHALLREELQDREKSENDLHYRTVHRHLFAFFDTWLRSLPENPYTITAADWQLVSFRFEMAFHHLMRASPGEAITWLLTYQHWIAKRAEWGLLQRLHKAAFDSVSQTRLPHDPERLLLQLNLAAIHAEQHRPAEARTTLQNVLAEIAGDEDSPDLTRLATFNLAQIAIRENDHGSAERYLEAALKRGELDDPPDPIWTYRFLACLGETKLLLGKADEARDLFWRHLRLAVSLPEKFGSISDPVQRLAQACSACGELQVAIPLYWISHGCTEYPDVPVSAIKTDLVLPDNHSGAGQASVEPTVIGNLQLFERWVERRVIGAFDRLLSAEARVDVWSYAPEKWAFSSDLLRLSEALSSASLTRLEDLAISALERFESEQVTNMLIARLVATPTGKVLVRSMQLGDFRFALYHARGMDFGIDVRNRIVWLSAPDFSLTGTQLLKLEIMAVYALRLVDQHLLGLSVDMNRGVSKVSEILHGKALDALVHLSRFVNEQAVDRRGLYLNLLSFRGAEFVNAVAEERNPEELFDIYASFSFDVASV